MQWAKAHKLLAAIGGGFLALVVIGVIAGGSKEDKVRARPTPRVVSLTSTELAPLPSATAVAATRQAATSAPATQAPAQQAAGSTTAPSCPQGCSTPPAGCAIKGNISTSDGARIYHVPGGGSYAQTTVTPSTGERWFCTEAEAIANGWRKAQN